MAYDSARGTIVMFGGKVPWSPLGDTWEWDGTRGDWTQRSPAVSPAPQSGHAMAYDSARGKVVLFGGETWEWDGSAGTWTQRFPSVSPFPAGPMAYDSARGKTVLVTAGETWEWDGAAGTWTRSSTVGPSARTGHAIAYDSARGRIVLFGGENTAYLRDTWEWDGVAKTWTQTATTGPSARSRHQMAYDSARQVTVLFGGPLTADTWEWDGTAQRWTRRTSTMSPSERHDHAMAYDSGRGRTVLFAGDGYSFEPRADTWEWDGTAGQWAERNPGMSPSPRWGSKMAYDSARDRVVLFSGYVCCNALPETWEWDGASGTWTQTALSLRPFRRWGHAMVYDSARRRVVLFAGYAAPADTWEWDGAIWTQRTSTASPSRRYGHGMAYDSARNKVVLFGGLYVSATSTVGSLTDTWEWDGTAGTWTERHPAISPPASPYMLEMIYDSARDKSVLFGPGIWEWDGALQTWSPRTATTSPPGINAGVAYDGVRDKVVRFGGNDPNFPQWWGDTWEWDGTRGTWGMRSSSTSPSARSLQAMAYDSARGTVVLFGGNSFGYSAGDTWEYHIVISDGGTPDASADAATADATMTDALSPDALIPDAMEADAPALDASPPDALIPDAGPLDAEASDVLAPDASASDALAVDAIGGSSPDAGTRVSARGCGCDAAQHDSSARATDSLARLVLVVLLGRIGRRTGRTSRSLTRARERDSSRP
jgi:hypothetical protein